MDWLKYSKLYRLHFKREISEFVSFIIHELEIDYNARVLEIGSNPGWICLELARRMPEVEVVSIGKNNELVHLANQNKADAKISNVNFLNWRQGKLDDFPNGYFDCVISFKDLAKWESPSSVFNTIKRVLKKDGKYALIDYRNDLKAIAKAVIWYRSKTMSKEFREHWKNSFDSSYSLQQVVKLLLHTELKDWKIRTTLFDYFIYKV